MRRLLPGARKGLPMSEPLNRIRDHLPGACGCRIKPAPTLGDKLLASAHRLKLEVWRLNDGDAELTYEIHGSLNTGCESDDDGDTISQEHSPADLRRLAAALLASFTSKEGGAS